MVKIKNQFLCILGELGRNCSSFSQVCDRLYVHNSSVFLNNSFAEEK